MKSAFGVVMFVFASGCWGEDPGSDETGRAQALEPSVPGESAAASSPVPPASAPAQEKHQAGTHGVCRALMLRQRACSAQLIPALVDARVERDDPKGTAAHARDVGREALLTEAFDEWALDSSDARIEAVCSEIAQALEPGRAPLLERSASACLERAGCDAFVQCAVPLNLGHWKG
jgi:hypothetical protein